VSGIAENCHGEQATTQDKTQAQNTQEDLTLNFKIKQEHNREQKTKIMTGYL